MTDVYTSAASRLGANASPGIAHPAGASPGPRRGEEEVVGVAEIFFAGVFAGAPGSARWSR